MRQSDRGRGSGMPSLELIVGEQSALAVAVNFMNGLYDLNQPHDVGCQNE